MEVENPWFDFGVLKTPKSPKWENIQVGNTIDVTCKETGEVRKFIVNYIHEYENLEEYLTIEGLDRCLLEFKLWKKELRYIPNGLLLRNYQHISFKESV